MKPKKILLLALLSGLITTFVFYLFIGGQQPQAIEQPVATVSVVTAAVDLQENQEITAESLTVTEMPETQVHSEAVLDPAEITGRFTSAPIRTGEVVMQHRIRQDGEADIASQKVTEGHRAVSITVDFVKSVSNLIEPDDTVDVVLTKTTEQPEGPVITTEMVLEKVKVLAVGKRLTEAKEGEMPPEYLAVTLELVQEDAVKLVEASSKGSLQLLLHSKLVSETTEETPPEQQGADTASEVISLPERSLIRSGPSLTAPVIGVVEAGTELSHMNEEEIDGDGRWWLRVTTPEAEQGWISSRIIKYENE